jgi:hypothetical protein
MAQSIANLLVWAKAYQLVYKNFMKIKVSLYLQNLDKIQEMEV